MTQAFSTKLDLVLKALTMSRGRLAAELGVDKSLVGRWVSGAVNPSAHNLANLSALIAAKKAGFTLLDWDRDIADLARLFGVEAPAAGPAPSAPASGPSGGLPLEMLVTARHEVQRRGHAYEGFWRTLRPSSTEPGWFAREQVMIAQQDGLLHVRWGTVAYEWSGWALLLHNQLYVMIGDIRDHSLVFLLLDGVNNHSAVELDGLMLGAAADRAKTPTSSRILLQRTGSLAASAEENERRFATARDAPFRVPADEVAPELRAQLLRDFGPAAFAAGGELLLQVPWSLNRSRGAFMPDVFTA